MKLRKLKESEIKVGMIVYYGRTRKIKYTVKHFGYIKNPFFDYSNNPMRRLKTKKKKIYLCVACDGYDDSDYYREGFCSHEHLYVFRKN